MKKPILKYVELWGGGCGLKTGSDASIRRACGTGSVKRIRPATDEDVIWVENMGGYVLDGRIAEPAKEAP